MNLVDENSIKIKLTRKKGTFYLSQTELELGRDSQKVLRTVSPSVRSQEGMALQVRFVTKRSNIKMTY